MPSSEHVGALQDQAEHARGVASTGAHHTSRCVDMCAACSK